MENYIRIDFIITVVILDVCDHVKHSFAKDGKRVHYRLIDKPLLGRRVLDSFARHVQAVVSAVECHYYDQQNKQN